MQVPSFITSVFEWIGTVVVDLGERVVSVARLLPGSQPAVLMVVALAFIVAIVLGVRLAWGTR